MCVCVRVPVRVFTYEYTQVVNRRVSFATRYYRRFPADGRPSCDTRPPTAHRSPPNYVGAAYGVPTPSSSPALFIRVPPYVVCSLTTDCRAQGPRPESELKLELELELKARRRRQRRWRAESIRDCGEFRPNWRWPKRTEPDVSSSPPNRFAPATLWSSRTRTSPACRISDSARIVTTACAGTFIRPIPTIR